MLSSAAFALVLVAVARAYDLSWSPGYTAPPSYPVWLQYFESFGAGTTFPSNDITVCGVGANVWGATFDDGPSENTHVVLDYFQSVGMKTTFWVVGAQVAQYPDVLARAHAAGHQIGLHTWSHPDLKTLSDEQVVAELVYAAKAVLEVTGEVPRYFRPPYGSINDNVRKIAAMMGLLAVTWTQDSLDWSYVGTGNMYKVPQAFQSWVDQGVSNIITLEHDLFAETVSVVKQNMDIVLKSGKRLVPLSECIGESNPYGNSILQGFFATGMFESRSVGSGRAAVSPKAPAPVVASSAPLTNKADAVLLLRLAKPDLIAPSTALSTVRPPLNVSPRGFTAGDLVAISLGTLGTILIVTTLVYLCCWSDRRNLLVTLPWGRKRRNQMVRFSDDVEMDAKKREKQLREMVTIGRASESGRPRLSDRLCHVELE